MISDTKLQQAINWFPHPAQQDIISSSARDIVICAGRRFGKSACAAYLALKTLLEDNKHIWIVSPTYDLSLKVFEYLVKWFAKVAPSQAANVQNRPYPRIKTARGSWIECKSAENPTSLLGEELDLIIVDEAARISRRVYDTYVYPTTTSRRGKTIFISTPFGQNWFYEKWIACKDSEDGASFHFTTLANPTFSPEEWERAKRILPAQVFAQEYEASFLPDAASVFRGIDEIIKDSCLQDVIFGRQYIIGVDLGKHEDFTVLTVIDKYNNNVVYFDRFNKIDYPFQQKRIQSVADRYNNARLIVDSTVVGEPIKEDLERLGLFVDDFKFSSKSKKDLIEKLSIFIEQKNVWIPPVEVLIDELRAFGYQLTDSGNVKYQAPQGLHDDCVCSLALAVWGLSGAAHPKTAIQQELEKRAKKPKNQSYV